jgi:hypothetical protein
VALLPYRVTVNLAEAKLGEVVLIESEDPVWAGHIASGALILVEPTYYAPYEDPATEPPAVDQNEAMNDDPSSEDEVPPEAESFDEP